MVSRLDAPRSPPIPMASTSDRIVTSVDARNGRPPQRMKSWSSKCVTRWTTSWHEREFLPAIAMRVTNRSAAQKPPSAPRFSARLDVLVLKADAVVAVLAKVRGRRHQYQNQRLAISKSKSTGKNRPVTASTSLTLTKLSRSPSAARRRARLRGLKVFDSPRFPESARNDASRSGKFVPRRPAHSFRWDSRKSNEVVEGPPKSVMTWASAASWSCAISLVVTSAAS